MRTQVAALFAGLWCLTCVLSALAANGPDFAAIVAANRAAVVNISSTSVATEPIPGLGRAEPGETPNHLLAPPPGRGLAPQPLITKSLGSGFVISPRGYILTCAHVIDHARRVTVRLFNRRDYVARVVGLDTKSDIALLKISAHNLPTVTIGHPSHLQAGDWVLAIGAPFGFGNSATAGIVSATGRDLPGSDYVPFIQTDVPINPGNSGGPLFDLRGHVVGINSQIYSRTGGFMGLSFAIPINLAMRIGHDLRTGGHVPWAWLGVTIQDVTRRLALSFRLPKPYGALVSAILPGSPAAHSGLRVGDVIVRFDHQPVMRSTNLPPLVGLTPVGSRVPVTVWRHGRPVHLKLTVGALPDALPATLHQPAKPRRQRAILGLALENLGAEEKRQLGVTGGVLVEGVTRGAAEKAGIEPGDVILSMAGRAVDNVATFRHLINKLPKTGPVAVLIRRGAGALFLPLDIR
ncbi:MAG: trypsin-like peptidase domain-containing protein [Gammaproteobacteria bacterium]|nr:trypsin-like peptidase domain-containing protein [Gammaproteobacteria bacterium]